ncbi:MAG: gluconate transporter [Williamsia sp.]|nr:gluconate transporter [Williamsia sp.]
MIILTILVCLLGLILLTAWLHINPFLAFLLVSLLAGWMLDLPPDKVMAAFQKGMGDTVGSLISIVCLGAMIGKLIATTGAAQKIAETFARLFGTRRIQWALLCTGFVVGTTLFYGVGFVLLTPLIFSVVFQYRLSAVYIGLPALAALSVTHGYLPPHPAPTALVNQLGADMGTTLLYGLVIAVPAVLVAGPLFAQTTKGIKAIPLLAFKPVLMPHEELPGAGVSFLTALLPAILLIIATPLSFISLPPGNLQHVVLLVSNPTVSILIALILGTYLLGIRRKRSMKTIMGCYESGIRDVSLILLIIGGAGALKQIFVEAGVDKMIGTALQDLRIPPLVLGWLIAAVIRIALGSSTIAGLMTAGIIHPLLVRSGVNPNLMVLSIGAGSMICSHVNDSGFWLFKEYFNLTMKQTFRTFTLMESLVAAMGLMGVLLLEKLHV